MELAYVIAGTMALGAVLFALERSRRTLPRIIGPWLLIVLVCVAITIIINPSREPYSWEALRSRDFLGHMLGAFGVLLSFAVEAVLISKFISRSKPSLIVFMATFVLASLAAWFLTFLAWSPLLDD